MIITLDTRTPTPEQWDALRRFATAHGRNWKQSLRDAWMSGTYGLLDMSDDSALLQQLRNTLGPSWLVKVRV